MIASSHPVCNTIMLVGVITCLVSVILLGIDGQFVNPENYNTVKIKPKITKKNTLRNSNNRYVKPEPGYLHVASL